MIINLASNPPSPRFARPPRDLTMSRSPPRWASSSFLPPQYHSFNISCMTPAMASSVVEPVVRR